jgi:hypothetical protein
MGHASFCVIGWRDGRWAKGGHAETARVHTVQAVPADHGESSSTLTGS